MIENNDWRTKEITRLTAETTRLRAELAALRSDVAERDRMGEQVAAHFDGLRDLAAYEARAVQEGPTMRTPWAVGQRRITRFAGEEYEVVGLLPERKLVRVRFLQSGDMRCRIVETDDDPVVSSPNDPLAMHSVVTERCLSGPVNAGVYCTRKRGHEGDHVAHNLHAGHAVIQWSQDPPAEVPARRDQKVCAVYCGVFACTRPLGHVGDHITHGVDGAEITRWPQRKKAIEAAGDTSQSMEVAPATTGRSGRTVEPHVSIANNPPEWAEPTAWRCAVAAAREWIAKHGVVVDTSAFAGLFARGGDVERAVREGDDRHSSTVSQAADAYNRARFQPSKTHAAFVPRERKRK